MTDLSIIIVCYKGWEPLVKCLDSLASFSGNSFTTEVFVVDNRSDDEMIFTIEKRYPKFRFIHNKINGGFANGSNLGAQHASGEFILFLNPDTVASESELDKLISAARQNSGYGILSCRQINDRGKESTVCGPFPSFKNITGLQRSLLGNRMSEIRNSKPGVDFPDWVSGSVIMMRRETFKELGGFDEDFWMYFEDVDLCQRVRNGFGEVAFCRDITIEHNHGGSSRVNLKTTALTKTEVKISQHVYISKHMRGVERFCIQIFLVMNNIITGALMAMIGLLLFFIPKLLSRTLIFYGLMNYYSRALFRLSWISPRSFNYLKN
jgi:GT2 family glycosyltransferase